MVLPAFNGRYLKDRLARLGKKQLLAFGAVCCERLLPNYVAFQQDSGYGDVAPVRRALDLVWASLDGRSFLADEVEEATAACESVAPNSDTFSSIFVTAAQDACFAVCSLLDFLHEGNVDKIVQVATYATDSVDLYIQETEMIAPNDPRLEERILAHHLMQSELQQQNTDLAAVERTPSMSQDFLVELKLLRKGNGRGNLDLP